MDQEIFTTTTKNVVSVIFPKIRIMLKMPILKMQLVTVTIVELGKRIGKKRNMYKAYTN